MKPITSSLLKGFDNKIDNKNALTGINVQKAAIFYGLIAVNKTASITGGLINGWGSIYFNHLRRRWRCGNLYPAILN